MTDRCDLTDLLVDQCAHCLGHSEHDTADVRIQRTVTAIHESRCAINGRHRIEVGDRIGYAVDATGDRLGWACTDCTEAGAR